MIYSECDKDLNISMKNKNIIIIIFFSILSFHFWTRKLKRTKSNAGILKPIVYNLKLNVTYKGH